MWDRWGQWLEAGAVRSGIHADLHPPDLAGADVANLRKAGLLASDGHGQLLDPATGEVLRLDDDLRATIRPPCALRIELDPWGDIPQSIRVIIPRGECDL